jgi:putative adenylate-forming enzyme
MSTIAILASYLRVRRRRFRSRAELLRWQDEQVQAFLRRVAPRSALTAQRFAGRGYVTWATLPVMDKAQMMAEFDALNTVGMGREAAMAAALRAESSRDFAPTLNGVTVGLSSGTSGARGLFLVSESERWQWAGAVLARLLPGSILTPQRVAFFLRANSNLYSSVRSRWIRFEYFDLLDPLENHLARLNEFQPTILAAPPSVLRWLAERTGGRRWPSRLKKIISVAEVLDPLDEAFIARGFGQRVHQVYQATEGFLAATCRLGTLHLNEDLVAIQRDELEAGGRKFAPIITDFHRESQPIIRYRLDDILTERAEPCACGTVLMALESIEGRCDDLFYFPAYDARAGRWVRVFPDYVRRALIGSTAELESYVVVQRAPDEVEIAFTAPVGARGRVEAAIAEGMRGLCERLRCEMPRLLFSVEQTRPGVRKLKRVERAFEVAEGEKERVS